MKFCNLSKIHHAVLLRGILIKKPTQALPKGGVLDVIKEVQVLK